MTQMTVLTKIKLVSCSTSTNEQDQTLPLLKIITKTINYKILFLCSKVTKTETIIEKIRYIKQKATKEVLSTQNKIIRATIKKRLGLSTCKILATVFLNLL